MSMTGIGGSPMTETRPVWVSLLNANTVQGVHESLLGPCYFWIRSSVAEGSLIPLALRPCAFYLGHKFP